MHARNHTQCVLVEARPTYSTHICTRTTISAPGCITDNSYGQLGCRIFVVSVSCVGLAKYRDTNDTSDLDTGNDGPCNTVRAHVP